MCYLEAKQDGVYMAGCGNLWVQSVSCWVRVALSGKFSSQDRCKGSGINLVHTPWTLPLLVTHHLPHPLSHREEATGTKTSRYLRNSGMHMTMMIKTCQQTVATTPDYCNGTMSATQGCHIVITCWVRLSFFESLWIWAPQLDKLVWGEA